MNDIFYIGIFYQEIKVEIFHRDNNRDSSIKTYLIKRYFNQDVLF